MRVAMVTETYPPEVNGVARTIGLMVEGLRKLDHSVHLVRPQQGESDRAARGSNFEELLTTGLPIPRYNQLKIGLPARRALVRAWSSNRPDIVHIATEGPLGWSALSAAAKLGLPVATDFHTNFHAYSRHYGVGFLARAVSACLRRFHNRADCTIVPTDEMAESLRLMDFHRLRIVGRGVDSAVFNPARRSAELRRSWGADAQTLVVLCVGRFAPEKNLPLVMDTYRAMRAARGNMKLVLVGDGPMGAELERATLGWVVAGRRLDEDLAAHYASADVFLFASTTETFGNVTLEAMASGLAVVAYDYAAAHQYIEDRRSGLLARFDDPEAFTAKAVGLAVEPARIEPLRREARRVAERLTWDAVMHEFAALLAGVIEQRSHGIAFARAAAA